MSYSSNGNNKRSDRVKAHLKRNSTRYIVLVGVTAGFAIGLSTRRAPAIKELGVYQFLGPNSPVKLAVTTQEAEAFAKVAATFKESMFFNALGDSIFMPTSKVPKEFYRVSRLINEYQKLHGPIPKDLLDYFSPVIEVSETIAAPVLEAI